MKNHSWSVNNSRICWRKVLSYVPTVVRHYQLEFANTSLCYIQHILVCTFWSSFITSCKYGSLLDSSVCSTYVLTIISRICRYDLLHMFACIDFCSSGDDIFCIRSLTWGFNLKHFFQATDFYLILWSMAQTYSKPLIFREFLAL